MARIVLVCAVITGSLFTAGSAHASINVSFGGYNWDQMSDPNTGVQLGVNDTTVRSGASFGPADNANLTRTSGHILGFIEGQAGVNTGIGYLSRITQRKISEAPNVLETSGTKAINLPQSANIGASLIRRGIQVGWTPGTNGFALPVLANGAGTDFVIFESGDANQPDALMARVRDAVTQLFSDWFFFTPIEKALTGSNSKLFAFEYDLSDMGFALGGQIDLIEMANMVSTDRIDAPGALTSNGWVAEGAVLPQVGGPFSATNPGPNPGNLTPPYGVPFGNSTYDPDPLYVAVLGGLQNFSTGTVPEPGSALVWLLLVGSALAARRKLATDR
jgi:hypothetical protein